MLLARIYLTMIQQTDTMIAMMTEMNPSTRLSVPTAMPTSLEHVHNAATDESPSPGIKINVHSGIE